MGLFEHFPYTNFHDLNLDVILKRVKDAEAAAQESAEDAAASAAIAQNIESIAVDAQTKANIALPLARTAEGKTAKHSYYEIFYDDINEAVTVTDLYTGTVKSSESNPAVMYQLANEMFGIDLNRPPLTPAELDTATKLPMIRLRVAGGGQNCWLSRTAITYKGLGGFSIQFYDETKLTWANITFSDRFNYARSTLKYIGLPDIPTNTNIDYENDIVVVKDGAWTIGKNPNPKFLVEEGILNTNAYDLAALLGSWTSSVGVRPWILLHTGANHLIAAYLTEVNYEQEISAWAAYFVSTVAGVSTVYKFTAADEDDTMTLVE